MSKPTLTVVTGGNIKPFSTYQGKRSSKKHDTSPRFTKDDLAKFAGDVGLELAQVSEYHFKVGHCNIFLPSLKCTVDGRTEKGRGFNDFIELVRKYEPQRMGNIRPLDPPTEFFF